jgi:hypothetical protein
MTTCLVASATCSVLFIAYKGVQLPRAWVGEVTLTIPTQFTLYYTISTQFTLHYNTLKINLRLHHFQSKKTMTMAWKKSATSLHVALQNKET